VGRLGDDLTGLLDRASAGAFRPEGYDFSQPNNWDLGPDGRFVMVKSDPSMRGPFELVQNFSEELKHLLPSN